MKKLCLFPIFYLLSISVSATMPGDEEFGANNTHCKYENYKKRDPASCPRVDSIVYGFTVYEHDDIQVGMQKYLGGRIAIYKDKSKHHEVYLKPNRSLALRKQYAFDNLYISNVPSDKLLKLQFITRLMKNEKKFILHTTISFEGNKKLFVVSDASEPLYKADVEKYLQGITDKFIHYVLAPVIFPDVIPVVLNNEQ